VTRMRSIGMLKPTQTGLISTRPKNRRALKTLTPPENIIVYTLRGVYGPAKIAVERFASKPPGEAHSEHEGNDERAEAVDTDSEIFEMFWY
jgi:hypothetical protein